MYVLDYHRQNKLIREMTLLRKDQDKWEVYYHHPSTNEMWKSYFPKANGNKRGPKILRTEPLPPTLEERMVNCLTSGDRENAIGLGIELSVSPTDWSEILAVADERYREFDRKLLRLFFRHLGIFKIQKLLAELHLAFEDIDLDRDEYKSLKWKARKILVKRFFAVG